MYRYSACDVFTIGKHKRQDDVFCQSDDFFPITGKLNRMKYVNRIAELRAAKEWTQQKLADEAGLSKGFISQLEKGSKQLTQDSAKKLADAFKVTVSAIYDDAATASHNNDIAIFSGVINNLHNIKVMGRLGKLSEWLEVEEGVVNITDSGGLVAFEVTEEGYPYKAGQIVIIDPTPEQQQGTEVLVRRERHGLVRHDVMTVREAQLGIATAYDMPDGSQYEPKAAEAFECVGVVLGAVYKWAMR